MKKAYRNFTTSKVTIREIGTMLVKRRIQVKYLCIAFKTQYLSKTPPVPLTPDKSR
jgi:hypothetical protein